MNVKNEGTKVKDNDEQPKIYNFFSRKRKN